MQTMQKKVQVECKSKSMLKLENIYSKEIGDGKKKQEDAGVLELLGIVASHRQIGLTIGCYRKSKRVGTFYRCNELNELVSEE